MNLRGDNPMNIFLTYVLNGRRCAHLTQHADVDDARGGAHVEDLGCSNERGADGEVGLPGSIRVILHRMPQRTAAPRDPHGRLVYGIHPRDAARVQVPKGGLGSRPEVPLFARAVPLRALIASDSPSPAIQRKGPNFLSRMNMLIR